MQQEKSCEGLLLSYNLQEQRKAAPRCCLSESPGLRLASISTVRIKTREKAVGQGFGEDPRPTASLLFQPVTAADNRFFSSPWRGFGGL